MTKPFVRFSKNLAQGFFLQNVIQHNNTSEYSFILLIKAMLMTNCANVVIRHITVTASFLHASRRFDTVPTQLQKLKWKLPKSIKTSSTEMSFHINDKFTSKIPTSILQIISNYLGLQLFVEISKTLSTLAAMTDTNDYGSIFIPKYCSC